MAPITSKRVPSSDGGMIYAEATGDPTKPPLILIPGFSLCSYVFEKQFEDEELRKQLYLIRYDPRGHGQSVMPETEEGHASKLYADDFAAVCKAFGVVKPVVAGWSLAGAIPVDICEHLGADAISGIIYLASVISTDPDFFSRAFPPSLSEIATTLSSSSDVAAYKTTMIAFGDSVFLSPEAVPIQTRCAWMGGNLLQPATVAKHVLSRKQNTTKLFEAGRKGLPVLFVQGDHDQHRSSSTIVVELVGEYFTKKEAVVMKDAGHAFFYEKPEETNKLLLDFTRRVASS